MSGTGSELISKKRLLPHRDPVFPGICNMSIWTKVMGERQGVDSGDIHSSSVRIGLLRSR